MVFLLLFYAFSRDKILMRENSYKSSYKRGLSPPNKGTLFETETEYLFVFSKLSVGV